MKAGEIVKIDGKIYEVQNFEHYCNKGCPLLDKCPIRDESEFKCLYPHKLSYGRWYSCNDVMPEDFGLIRVLLVLKLKGHYELRCRWNEDGKYFWNSYPDNEVTHWLAIPPLDKEE